MASKVTVTKKKIRKDEAWEMLKSANLIRTGRGKKLREWNPATDNREDILKDVMGPGGNLRAPTWKIGNEFLVGFNQGLYEDVFS